MLVIGFIEPILLIEFYNSRSFSIIIPFVKCSIIHIKCVMSDIPDMKLVCMPDFGFTKDTNDVGYSRSEPQLTIIYRKELKKTISHRINFPKTVS